MELELDETPKMNGNGKPKLLLADDSVTIRKVVELTFADEGVEVTAVGGGEEAMQKFVEIEPDIVLLDVNMPDPTGYQICEMIKQDEATHHIPVLLLVGSFEPFDQDEAERVGADGFIVKPFQSIRDLVGKVNELLGPDKEPVLPVPETNDIDHLYENSFAETYRMDGESSSDIYLGDAGIDDEIIEMTHPSGDSPEPMQVYSDDAAQTENDIAALSSPAQESEDIFEGFDWAVIPPAPEPEPEPQEDLSSNGHDELADEHEEPEAHAQYVENEAPESAVLEFSDTDEFDVDTLRDMEVESEAKKDGQSVEMSDEFITEVARRVIEKLSDRVIREIAKDAVPRIAEDLIREALEEDKKS